MTYMISTNGNAFSYNRLSKPKQSDIQGFRGAIFHCLSDPDKAGSNAAVEYFEDGLLLVNNGRVLNCGPAAALIKHLPDNILITDYSGKLILPGLIDCHVHYPQTDIIASRGKQLLDWLETYTFPAEAKFAQQAHAEQAAEFFLDELLRNGTTTAMVMPTVHATSVEAFFKASQQRKLRMISGKVMMDQNAPEYLLDTPETAYQESKNLIEKWHRQDRLSYAITPRFAPTSSEQQLAAAGRLAAEYPDTYIHSHVAENQKEVEWVAKLFPWSRSYLDVYDRYNLLRERAIYAHGIYLDIHDLQRLQQTGAALAFCPTSNNFLGSGLFDLHRAQSKRVKVGLATDVGGGTSFSMLQTMSDAYKVQQHLGVSMSSIQGFYLATLGAATALNLQDKLGNFAAGKEADFIVMDLEATPLIKRRLQSANSIEEKLFIMMMLGDDRAISATHILGQCVYTKPALLQ